MSRFKVETENIVQNSGNMLYYSKKMNQIGSAVNSVSNNLSLNSDNIAYLKISIRDISSSIIENAGKMEVLSNALNEIAKEYNNTEKKVCDCSTQNKTAVSHTGAAFEVPNGTFVAGDPDEIEKIARGVYDEYQKAYKFPGHLYPIDAIAKGFKTLVNSAKFAATHNQTPLIGLMIQYVENLVEGAIENKSPDQFTADFFADIILCFTGAGILEYPVLVGSNVDIFGGKTADKFLSDIILEQLEKEHVYTKGNINKVITPEEAEKNRIAFKRYLDDAVNARKNGKLNLHPELTPPHVPDVPFLSPAQ